MDSETARWEELHWTREVEADREEQVYPKIGRGGTKRGSGSEGQAASREGGGEQRSNNVRQEGTRAVMRGCATSPRSGQRPANERPTSRTTRKYDRLKGAEGSRRRARIRRDKNRARREVEEKVEVAKPKGESARHGAQRKREQDHRGARQGTLHVGIQRTDDMSCMRERKGGLSRGDQQSGLG